MTSEMWSIISNALDWAHWRFFFRLYVLFIFNNNNVFV